MSIIKSSFTRNLRGYLSAAKITSAFSTGKTKRTTKSLSSDPVEPIDAVFSTFQDHHESPDHVAGFQTITQHLLASHVLENLLQLQNEISSLSDVAPHETDGPNAKAARAYQHIQENLPQTTATIYTFGDELAFDSEVTPR